jgi:hypothetical protein
MTPQLIIGLGSLALGLGSTISGNVKANTANAKREALIKQHLAEVDNELKKDYVNTSEAQAVLQAAKEDLEEQAQRDEGRAAMTGATHEAKLAAREKFNNDYANIVRQVAGGATAWRNGLLNRKAAILGEQSNLYAQQAQAGGNQIASGANTMVSSANSIANASNSKNSTNTNNNAFSGEIIDSDIGAGYSNTVNPNEGFNLT